MGGFSIHEYGFVFVNSGFVVGGFTPTLVHFGKNGNHLKADEAYLRKMK